MLLLSLALILFPFAFLDRGFSNPSKKIIIFIFCVVFTIFGSIRWNTGTDWVAYHDAFKIATTYYDAVQSPYTFEWGFGMFYYLVNCFTNSYSAFLFFFTFLTIFIKYKVITNKEFIGYGLLTFYLYFCYTIGDIVATRQALAVSITLFSILFIIKRKLFSFLLCIFIATLIHRSSIIFIFAYYIYNLRVEKKTLLIVFISSMALGLGLSQFQFLAVKIPFLSNIELLSSYQDKVETYTEIGQTTYGSLDSTTTNILGYLKKLLFILPLILLRRTSDSIHARLLTVIIFGSSLYFILGALASDFKRLNTYFEILEILVLPYFLYQIDRKKMRYILIFIYCIFSFIRLYSAISTYWDLYDPFLTIFDFHNTRQMF